MSGTLEGRTNVSVSNKGPFRSPPKIFCILGTSDRHPVRFQASCAVRIPRSYHSLQFYLALGFMQTRSVESSKVNHHASAWNLLVSISVPGGRPPTEPWWIITQTQCTAQSLCWPNMRSTECVRVGVTAFAFSGGCPAYMWGRIQFSARRMDHGSARSRDNACLTCQFSDARRRLTKNRLPSATQPSFGHSATIVPEPVSAHAGLRRD